jgi:hypothetical protein
MAYLPLIVMQPVTHPIPAEREEPR